AASRRARELPPTVPARQPQRPADHIGTPHSALYGSARPGTAALRPLVPPRCGHHGTRGGGFQRRTPPGRFSAVPARTARNLPGRGTKTGTSKFFVRLAD